MFYVLMIKEEKPSYQAHRQAREAHVLCSYVVRFSFYCNISCFEISNGENPGFSRVQPIFHSAHISRVQPKLSVGMLAWPGFTEGCACSGIATTDHGHKTRS